MNYFPFHIGDYRGATGHLSNEEDLCYRRLLDMYYDKEKPIPLETQWVAKRLRTVSETVESVLNDFFLKQEDGWHHEICDRVLAEYRALAEKNRTNGSKGGRPKKKTEPNKPTNNPLGSQSVPKANPLATDSEGNQEPITNNHKPSTKAAASLFDEFWKAYPKKASKDAARKAFLKREPDRALLDAMLAAIAWQSKTEKWTKEQGEFIPYPASWLNAGAWTDEPVKATAGPGQVSAIWHESAAGVAAKAIELRLAPQGTVESHPAFKARVMAATALATSPALGMSQLAAMAAKRQTEAA